jgi:hypothetical protein
MKPTNCRSPVALRKTLDSGGVDGARSEDFDHLFAFVVTADAADEGGGDAELG